MSKAVRLDKFLADAGKGTRSEVKKQIKAGLVTVNGAVAKKPEQKVDETGDEVCLRFIGDGMEPHQAAEDVSLCTTFFISRPVT